MANGDITYSNVGCQSADKPFASGKYIGLATANIDILCGFTPAMIVLHNDTDDTEYKWFTGITQGSMFQRVAAGDKTLESVTGAPIPIVEGMVDADGAKVAGAGFRVPLGTTTVINTTADVVYWEAWK